MMRVHLGILAGILLLVGSLHSQADASACGTLGLECCGGTTCTGPGLTCLAGTCRDCGVTALGCCDEEPICADGYVCASPPCAEALNGQGGGAEICVLDCLPCGAEEQRCCAKGGCDGGLTCQPRPPSPCETGGEAGADCEVPSGTGSGAGPAAEICLPCGDLGQPCCPGHGESICDNENLLCGEEFCEACGNIGEQCCPNETCPNSSGLCISGVCQPGPAPAMSSNGLVVMVVILSGIAFFGMRRLRA